LTGTPVGGIIKFDADLVRTMLDIANDIRSLSDFKRNTSELLDRLKKTGNPLVLTINGKARAQRGSTVWSGRSFGWSNFQSDAG